MATFLAIIDGLKYGFKFGTLIFNAFKKKPSKELRKDKAKLDKALHKAKTTNDLRELSKWFGGHI